VVSTKAIAPEAIVAETLKTNIEAEAKAVGVTVVITEAPAVVVVTPAPTTAPTGATPIPQGDLTSASMHSAAAPLAAMAAVLAQIFA